MQYQLAHKIKLDPTALQENYFKQACGIARFTWNWALAQWQEQYEKGLKPSGFALKKQFNAIKPIQFPWTYDVTKYASQQPFIFLQQAFSRFFKKTSRYPRFKKRGVNDSFYIGNDHIKVEGNRIKIPKLGWVKMRESLRFTGKLVSATISRIANKWFVSLQVVIDEPRQPCESQACVGVDLGIKRLATLFDGQSEEREPGSKPLKRLLKKLKREQRRLSRKQKGSQNREKQRIKVALLHYRIRCIRQDTLHKLTTKLTQRYLSIGIEDLNVKGMMSNRKLARSVADMGFYEFRRQLSYKSELRGNNVVIADRWFPSSKRCSYCHNIKKDLALKDREYHCDQCGTTLDRDLNAAKNLFSTVSSTGFEACGEEGSGIKYHA